MSILLTFVFVKLIRMEELPYIDLIRQIMIERSLSQEKFAAEINVNQTTVSQWLLGHKKPGYDNILAICVKFKVSPNVFFNLEY